MALSNWDVGIFSNPKVGIFSGVSQVKIVAFADIIDAFARVMLGEILAVADRVMRHGLARVCH